MVLATQNPLEQEGTFSLPEAQLDRFLLKTIVEYPSREEEKYILKEMIQRENQKISKIF
jgi:MoxR-like ATPase